MLQPIDKSFHSPFSSKLDIIAGLHLRLPQNFESPSFSRHSLLNKVSMVSNVYINLFLVIFSCLRLILIRIKNIFKNSQNLSFPFSSKLTISRTPPSWDHVPIFIVQFWVSKGNVATFGIQTKKIQIMFFFFCLFKHTCISQKVLRIAGGFHSTLPVWWTSAFVRIETAKSPSALK